MVKFKDNLINIKNELSTHKKSKEELILILMQERLNGSLKNYYNELNNTINRLSNVDVIQLDRNLNEDDRYIRRLK